MPAKTIEDKVDELSQEVATLRSLVISIVTQKDPEGEYEPDFVKKVREELKETPTFAYGGRGSLLKQLKQAK